MPRIDETWQHARPLGHVSRRGLLRTGVAAGGALALGQPAWGEEPAPASTSVPYVPRPGATQYRFQVQPTTLDPDGKQPVPAITVNGRYPGPEIRVREGTTLRVAVQNQLPDQPTAIHWHGLLLPAGMDGVPDVANFPIAPQRVYVYEYPLRQSGTYWYHSHWGFQEQIGLAGPFVIEPQVEPLQVDHDVVVMLGDWLHRPPDAVFAALRKEPAAGAAPAMPMAPGATMPPGPSPGMKMAPGQAMQPPTTRAPAAGMQPPATTPPAAGTPPGTTRATGMAMGSGAKADLSDITYDAFLLNGRGPQDPWTLAAKPGERIRLRLINAGTSTYFHVRLDGHPLQITHADGLTVEPVTVDHVLMGMAEIYDAVVALTGSGSYTLHAVAQDGSGQAIGVLHTPDVAPAPNRALPPLDGRALAYTDLRATTPTTLPAGTERPFTLALGGDMSRYVWTINDQAYPKADPLLIREGERVSIALVNRTMMWHPMHLHGHFFRVLQGAGERAPLKHTVNVAPGETVRIEFAADNPGRWFFHCHNLYHLEGGMARVFEYEA